MFSANLKNSFYPSRTHFSPKDVFVPTNINSVAIIYNLKLFLSKALKLHRARQLSIRVQM
jgi:hypothetical protein